MLAPAILYLFFSFVKPVILKQKNRIKIVLKDNLNCMMTESQVAIICYFETKNSIKTA